MNLSQMWNTPGYYYATGYALAAMLIVSFQRLAAGRWKVWLGHGALFLFLNGFMFLTRDAQNGRFIVSIAVIILAIYLDIFFAIRNKLSAGFFCIKAFIYGEFCASMCWQIVYYLTNKIGFLHRGFGEPLIQIATFAVIMTILALGERMLYRDISELSITKNAIMIEIVTAVIVFTVSDLGYLDRDGLFSGSFARDIFTIRTLVDLCGVVLLFALHEQMCEAQLRREKDALYNIMVMQHQAYEISKESIDMVNQKYHDLKHQIALLKGEGTTEKTEAYLQQMEREIQGFEVQKQTGNHVLNVILTAKGYYCQAHGIDLKYSVDGELLGFMEDMEISALFGNMLDNAIESVERLDSPEKRQIRLNVTKVKQFLCIRIENYCEETITFEDGLPVTTKKDKQNHGFGMKSMRKTVTKYEGSMVTSYNDSWFKLKILIPLA